MKDGTGERLRFGSSPQTPATRLRLRTSRCLGLVFLLFAAAACGGVTETGNPCPTGDCPTSAPAGEGLVYANAAFGVSVAYPSGWSVEELSSDVAEFLDQRSPSTRVRMTFARPSPAPESLEAYLAAAYPGRNFVEHSAGSNRGYLFDDPAAGGSGGDLQEYFFLGGDVLIDVTAEVFTEGEADLGSLLAGISFTG